MDSSLPDVISYQMTFVPAENAQKIEHVWAVFPMFSGPIPHGLKGEGHVVEIRVVFRMFRCCWGIRVLGMQEFP